MSKHYGRRDVLRVGASALAAGAFLSAGNASASMYLDTPPKIIEPRIFTQMPNEFRRKGERSAWADANKGGRPVDSFIEGPCFAADGSLYITDIPFGRVFRISPAGVWTLIAQYDGEPNGLKFHPDGRILIADYKCGLMELDPVNGKVIPVLQRKNSEAFKGINDLAISDEGDIYFTDQGQTGLQDPTGRVFHLSPERKLELLLNTGPSPNGIFLAKEESVLYVSMTRDNSVWRVPLLGEGGTAKVARFCSFFGKSGPDGLSMDEAGNLVVAHASLGNVFLIAPSGECIARIKAGSGTTCTNSAFGGPKRQQLFITESMTGTVLVADMPHPGAKLATA
jgi:gluconolactonase